MRSTDGLRVGGPLPRSRADDERATTGARQCRATFQFDPIGTKLIEDMGVETLMWGSDYPHPDGVWPQSSATSRSSSAISRRTSSTRFTCENAGKFYGLMRESPMNETPIGSRRAARQMIARAGYGSTVEEIRRALPRAPEAVAPAGA